MTCFPNPFASPPAEPTSLPTAEPPASPQRVPRMYVPPLLFTCRIGCSGSLSLRSLRTGMATAPDVAAAMLGPERANACTDLLVAVRKAPPEPSVVLAQPPPPLASPSPGLPLPRLPQASPPSPAMRRRFPLPAPRDKRRHTAQRSNTRRSPPAQQSDKHTGTKKAQAQRRRSPRPATRERSKPWATTLKPKAQKVLTAAGMPILEFQHGGLSSLTSEPHGLEEQAERAERAEGREEGSRSAQEEGGRGGHFGAPECHQEATRSAR